MSQYGPVYMTEKVNCQKISHSQEYQVANTGSIF